MPLSPNTWSDGSKVQDLVSEIETAGAGVYCKKLACSMEIVGLGTRLILSPVAMHLMKTQVGHFPQCMVHYKQFKGLNVGELSFFFKPFILCLLAWITSISFFTFVSKFWDGTEW